jgi:D-alanine--poly(phosphoribitol) ligase subunit 2
MDDPGAAKVLIRGKIAALAKALGHDAAKLRDDDVLPQTGLLDSASLMMLIVWYEEQFGVSTENDELTIDNFGTINLMVDYLQRHG